MRRWPSLSLGIVLSAAVAEIACGDSFSADSAPENSSAGEGGEPDGGTAGSGGAGGSSGSGTTGGRGGSTGAGGSTATGGDAGDAGDAGESGTGGAAGNGAMGGGSGVSGASGNGGRGGVSGGGASGRSGAGGGGVGGVSGTGGVGGLGGAGKGGTGGTSGGKGGTGGSGMGGTAGTSGTGGVAGVSGTGGASCQMNCALNGFTCCNGRCVNTRNDIKNCGTCGEVCDGSFPICLDGQCTIPVCLGPDCGPGRGCCENTCCAIGELCCKVPGGPDGPPRCTAPVDGTCPMGCPMCPCASPGTPVATPSGERPIAELRAGDLVYSVHDGAIVAVPIERVSKNPVAGHYVLRLRLETGATLEVSAMHPTADGRTLALATPGSELGGVRVVTVDEIPYQHAYTYDILPASDTGTYFAAGALIGSTLFAERSARD